MRSTLLVATLLLPPTIAQAAPDDEPVEVTVGGYVEAYVQANLQRPADRVTRLRAFDDRSGALALANAVVDVQAQRGRVRARIALQAGTTGASYYQAEPSLPAAGGAPASDAALWRHLQAATMTIAAPRDITVEAGLFPSPIGLEVIPTKDNWTWSRSDLFFALPFYHAGLNVSRPLTRHLTARLHAWNGWNAALDGNDTPTGGASLAYADATTSAQLLYVAGVERPEGAPEGQPVRHLVDAYVQHAVSDVASVALHVDGGGEAGDLGTSRWLAGAAYGRLALSDTLAVAARVDLVREWTGGASPILLPTRWLGSATTTLAYQPLDGLALRLEYRHDQAADPVLVGDAAGQPTRRQQDTFTVGGVAWF